MNALRVLCAGLCVGLFAFFATSCGDTAACTPDTCDGCCDDSGTCQPGNVPQACGADGDACVSCGEEACETGGACHWDVIVEGPAEYEPGQDPDGPHDGEEGIDRFCDGQLEALCGFMLRCGYVQTVEGCEERGARLREGDTCGLNEKAAVRAGRAVFREDHALACLEWLRGERACRPYQELPELTEGPCAELLDRTDDDPSCFGQTECAQDHYCAADARTCPGSCVAKKGEGERAPSDAACAEGLSLQMGICTAPLTTPGASCAGVAGPSLRCADGMFCATEGCAPYLTEGESCPGGACTCAPGLALQDDTCRPLANAGEACGTGATCKMDLLCLNGVCAQTGAQGASCGTSEECDAALYCASGQCTPRLGMGEAGCQQAPDCQPGLSCGPQATCVESPGDGEPCQSGDRCGPGLDCEDLQPTTGTGTCRPALCLAAME
jgi:hypothetical protein